MKMLLRTSVVALAVFFPGTVLAWPLAGPPHMPPVKVDAGINCRFNVYLLDQAPLAPWYTYWPADAYNQTPVAMGAQYPNWPSQWPPAAPANFNGTPLGQAAPQYPQGGYTPGPVNPLFQPGNSSKIPQVQPYPPVQHAIPPAYNPYGGLTGPRPVAYYEAPSYWYGK